MALHEEGCNGTITLSSAPVRGQLQPQNQGRAVAVAEQKAFKGIRMRRWGRWVSEIRIPRSRARIWLGSYDAPEKAARAYDAALYCLHGGRGRFNFPHEERPEFPEELRLALSKRDIKAIAARFALSSSSSSPPACSHLGPPYPVASPPRSSVAAGWSEEYSDQLQVGSEEDAAANCDDINPSLMDEDVCGSPFGTLDDSLLRDPAVSEISSIWDLL